MANQDAFSKPQVRDEQIDIAATLKIPKQILLVAQDRRSAATREDIV